MRNFADDYVQAIVRTWAVDLVASMMDVRHILWVHDTGRPEWTPEAERRADEVLAITAQRQGWVIMKTGPVRVHSDNRMFQRANVTITRELFVVVPKIPDGSIGDWIGRMGPKNQETIATSWHDS